MIRNRASFAPLISLAVLLGVSLPASAQDAPDAIAVDVANHSEPVLCAEKDNVHLSFRAPALSGLRIQAVHPAYIGALVADRSAPDWTSCDIPITPSDSANVRRVTIYETPEEQLIGYVFPSFWRAAKAAVRVGERAVEGLHLVQYWIRHQDRAEEVLVIYPPDGYWRARPLPPPHLRWSAYGSSFLVGPVEMAGRPIVDLVDIRFDPSARAFELTFARGGKGSLRIADLDRDRMVLDVAFSGVAPGHPFAALRSMYVTEINNDVARVAWRAQGAKAWQEAPVLDFRGGRALELWAGRVAPSRHNTSAPDMVFGPFRK